MNYSVDWNGPGEHDDDPAFDEWIRQLDQDVIQAEFGYEEGEFSVYPERWWPLYDKGFTPREAWQRALDAHKQNTTT